MPRADARAELRLPQDLLATVDGHVGRGGRSAYAREAIREKLGRDGVLNGAVAAPREPADPAGPAEASGCPECSGALSGVLDRPGVNACVDCGWTG